MCSTVNLDFHRPMGPLILQLQSVCSLHLVVTRSESSNVHYKRNAFEVNLMVQERGLAFFCLLGFFGRSSNSMHFHHGLFTKLILNFFHLNS